MARQEGCVSSKALSPSGDPSLLLTSSSQAVRFLLEPSTTFVETSWKTSHRISTKMSTHSDIFPREQVTDTMLAEAANLFSENYGTWGKHSHSPGKPVKIGSRRLREQYLPEPSDSVHARATVNGNLAGTAFACRWRYDDKNICWVTQLVVSRDYRERGLASGLLRSLRMEADDIYGILSSHPAACLAAASSFGSLISNVPLDFAKKNARLVMDASPIAYIQDAELRGTLFELENSTELVCGVDTGFFVDHDEPLAALGMVRENWDWPLGGLPDGYEFLLILPAKRRRSISRSPSNPGGVPPAERPQLTSPNPNTPAKRQSISHSSSNPEDMLPAKRRQSTRLSQAKGKAKSAR